MDEIANNRIEICKTCEHYREWFCANCGCILPVKVRIENSSCPINKW